MPLDAFVLARIEYMKDSLYHCKYKACRDNFGSIQVLF